MGLLSVFVEALKVLGLFLTGLLVYSSRDHLIFRRGKQKTKKIVNDYVLLFGELQTLRCIAAAVIFTFSKLPQRESIIPCYPNLRVHPFFRFGASFLSRKKIASMLVSDQRIPSVHQENEASFKYEKVTSSNMAGNALKDK